MTKQQLKAVAAASEIILTTVKESNGAPEGYIYAAFMQQGLNIDQFNGLMRPLYGAGALKVSNHYVTVGENYETTLNKIQTILRSV